MDTLTYEDLKTKTIAELRELARSLHHDSLQGYTQMNKEHLLPALCTALGIDSHHHAHRPHVPAADFDKAAVKAQIRTLKAEREKAIATGDHDQLKVVRRRIHTLKRQIRTATV